MFIRWPKLHERVHNRYVHQWCWVININCCRHYCWWLNITIVYILLCTLSSNLGHEYLMNTYSAGLSLSDTLMHEDSGARIMLFAYIMTCMIRHIPWGWISTVPCKPSSTLIVVDVSDIFLQLHALVAHAQVNSWISTLQKDVSIQLCERISNLACACR